MKTKSKKEAAAPAKVTHSPGPYFYEHDRDGVDDIWRIISQPDQSTIATLSYWGGDDPDEYVARVEANARLFAASADMFDALKEVVAAFNRLDITVTDGPLFRALRYARHAVALADGTLSYRAC
jgi:hypothetical protein